MSLLPTVGPLSPSTSSDPRASGPTPEMAQTARDFEAAFLAEALGHMGLDASQGVEGAAPFASFVNRAYAGQLADRGGIGLAESIVRSLARHDTPA